MKKMTFSTPEPSAAGTEEREAALIRACEMANQEPDVAEIERDFDGLGDADGWE